MQKTAQKLRDVAGTFLERARAQFSGKPAAAVVLLPEGVMVPGVRVESASFPLTIPASLNAVTTAFALGHRDFAAVALSGPVPPTTDALLSGFGMEKVDTDFWQWPWDLPEPTGIVDPFMDEDLDDPTALVQRARTIARRAHIPESEFPVAAIVRDAQGRLIPGVNVEHPDWACILCAERNALGTAVTYSALPIDSLALSCPTAPGASPCGACRQLIAELAPDAVIWMDRGARTPEASSPLELLPMAFTGDSLGS